MTGRQQAIPVVYETVRIEKQLLSYLKMADQRLGLLIHFNVVLIKNGITRIVNRLPEDLSQRR